MTEREDKTQRKQHTSKYTSSRRKLRSNNVDVYCTSGILVEEATVEKHRRVPLLKASRNNMSAGEKTQDQRRTATLAQAKLPTALNPINLSEFSVISC